MADRPGLGYRLRQAIKFFQGGMPAVRGGQKSRPYAWPTYMEGRPQWQLTDLRGYVEHGYSLNTLIYSAINYKVRASYSAPLRAYEGDPDNPEVLDPGAELAAVVERPNPYQSKRAFIGLLLTYLNIAGNSYVLMDRKSKDAVPSNMWCLRPDRVFIIPEAGNKVKGYLYVPEGKGTRDGVPVLPQDMAHIKLPNPLDPMEGLGYGMSPLMPAARSTDVDNAVTSFLKQFFDRGAVLPGLLKFDVPLDDATIGNIKRRWMELYGGGSENWTDIGVLDQGGEYKAISPPFNEMGFDAIDERNESRVLGPLGVPGILIGTRIGISHSTYSNFEEARKQFWEDTFVPELTLVEDELKYFLQDRDGEHFAAFDLSGVPALKANVPALVTAFYQAVSTGLTKNQAASLLELEVGDIEDGDVVYMPFSLQPIGGQGAGAEVGGQVMPDGTIVKPKPPAPKPAPDTTNEGMPEATTEGGQV